MDSTNKWGSKDSLFQVATVLGWLLCVLVLIFAFKQFGTSGGRHGVNDPISTISVSGIGEKSAVPDIATFSLTVTENAKTVAEAQAKATTKTNAAIKSLRDAGIADKDIKTSGYNINPRYEYVNGVCTSTICNPGKSVLTGYEVSQSIEVKVRDLAKAGDILTSIGSLGVQNVNGLNFTIEDINAAKAEAQAIAISDAKVKADKLARSLGVSIVRITSFGDTTTDPSYYYRGGVAMDMASAQSVKAPSPELPAGETKIISNVNITYEIR